MTHSAASRSARPQGRDEPPASDERLLTAVRNGDSAAFAELYERHRGAALAVARMHFRNESDAQDLVSEAFTRVLGLLREGKGPREFLRAYLVTAVSRLAADRANELTRTRPEDPQPNGPLDRVELFDDTVVRQVDSAVVARAFASLPERWQEILWYLEVEGRRPRQVAGVVGAQPNAVSALGKRAREGLRAAYVQEHVSARALEDCREYSSQLGAFTRGSLTPPRTKAVQDHLDGCPRCTAEYLQLQDLGLGLRGWILPV
ncbi:sigma-70 family RNA polymerase sigma factor, partial [Kocuria sp. HSID17582]